MDKFAAAKLAALPWTHIGTQEKKEMVSPKPRRTRRTAAKKAAPKKDTVKQKKAADAARLKAKAEADQKARHTALLRELKPIAKEINVRLQKAQTADGQAVDHRVSAAIHLGEVKTKCEADKMSFKKWCEENLDPDLMAYNTARQMARIGQSDNPKFAIEDLRVKSAKAQREYAERQKALAAEGKKAKDTTSRDVKPTKKVSSIDTAENALAALGDKGEASLVESRLAKQGRVVVSKSDSTRLQEFKDGKLAALQEAFGFMSGGDRMKFMRWAAEQVGVELVNKTTGEAVKKAPARKKAAAKKSNSKDAGGERPAFLNRSGKSGGTPRRTRRTAAGKSA